MIPVDGYGPVGDFELTNQDGQPFGSNDLKGKNWIGNFIFTRCQGPCPILSAKVAGLQKEFNKAGNLHFVSFSVDPDFDDPSVLKTYAKKYDADHKRWHFLTGKRKDIYNLIRTSFKLAVEEPPSASTDVMHILHSLHLVFVDQDGKIEGYYNSTDPRAVSDLKLKLSHLVKHPS
ncbi:hypothetical protein BVX98_03795 [bacterium F11]|nr:hypothetical protein BVX98_03795 [bacterium F11]